MHFFKALLVGAAAFVSQAAAQGTLAFTSVPTAAAVGQATVIQYTASDLNLPVTITLRKGNPLNLDTIGVLTSSATGGSYTWVPDASLASGNDYALQITQGNQINYSGQFPVTGGSASAVSSAQSRTSASASSVSSIASIISAISANGTASGVSLTTTTSSSVAVVIANITSAAPSMAASSAVNRNTTMSVATLTATTTAGATGATGATGAGASASSKASSAASSKASTAATSSSTVVPSNDASGLHSPLALIFGAVAAMIYLN